MGTTAGTACDCVCDERHGKHFVDPVGPPPQLWRQGIDLRPTATVDLPLYKHRLDAQTTLNNACAGNNAAAVQEAIAVGRACGVSQSELDDATAVVINLKLQSMKLAGEALVSALQDQDPDSLRQAIALADQAGLYSPELEKAMSMVEMLDDSGLNGSSRIEFRETLLGRLEKAINARGHKELVETIDEAESTGLLTRPQDRALLARARVLLNISVVRKQMSKRRQVLVAAPHLGTSFESLQPEYAREQHRLESFAPPVCVV